MAEGGGAWDHKRRGVAFGDKSQLASGPDILAGRTTEMEKLPRGLRYRLCKGWQMAPTFHQDLMEYGNILFGVTESQC